MLSTNKITTQLAWLTGIEAGDDVNFGFVRFVITLLLILLIALLALNLIVRLFL
jgi:hypothetical protein